MAYAMKIHLKKNAAAKGLELKERLQGLTATDVTHKSHIHHSLSFYQHLYNVCLLYTSDAADE